MPDIYMPVPIVNFALQNGTPVIAAWTTANDGAEHAVGFSVGLNVTNTETGGQISVTWTANGVAMSVVVIASAQVGPGKYLASGIVVADPNTLVTITQTVALSGGAAVVESAGLVSL